MKHRRSCAITFILMSGWVFSVVYTSWGKGRACWLL